MSAARLDRRSFLKAGAAGALVLGVPWPASGTTPGEAELNAFVTLRPDGSVRLTVPRSEMGQGILTALSMVVAEELDVRWEQVEARQAGANAQRYGAQGTGGSASVRTRFTDLRVAGAAVRELLVAAAAQRWSVPVDECETRDGQVRHASSQRTLDYGELLPGLAGRALPEAPRLKSPAQFRIIGRSRAPIDLDRILAGTVGYGVDQRLPGLVFAAIARCPVFGGSVGSVDDTEARALPGVLQVIPITGVPGNAGVSPGVAVVARDSWSALRARDALRIEWRAPAGELEREDAQLAKMASLLDAPPEDILLLQGEPDATLAAADRKLTADYRLPFLAHATLEPQNCTARFRNGRLELWSPTQTPNFSVMLAAGALSISPDSVQLEVTRIGGAFGRRLNADFTVEAALIARALDGTPVQVIWSREDDLQHDFYRPCAMHRLTASLDAAGNPQAWDHHLTTPAIFAGYQLPPNSERPGLYEATGAIDLPYGIAHRRCSFSRLPSRVPLGWWRAVSTTHTVFAVESFIDELAHAAGRDPLEFRLSLIAKPPATVPGQDPDFPFDPERLRALLMLAADQAGWGQRLPSGHGLGIACCRDHLTYAVQIVQASADDDGRIRVHRVVSALDCGLVINPEGVRAQVEGSVMQGLSAALRERMTIEDGRVAQTNFNDYPILRQAEAPARIDVLLRPTAAAPTGAGEPALPAVAPALANAVFAATGRRLRALPLTSSAFQASKPRG